MAAANIIDPLPKEAYMRRIDWIPCMPQGNNSVDYALWWNDRAISGGINLMGPPWQLALAAFAKYTYDVMSPYKLVNELAGLLKIVLSKHTKLPVMKKEVADIYEPYECIMCDNCDCHEKNKLVYKTMSIATNIT